MSAIKQMLTGGAMVAYYPALARAVGGIAPALFIQQIAHWEGRSEDGWVFRTQEQLEEELAMSVKVQQRCRKDLVDAGFLKEERRQPNARLYYCVNWANLEAALYSIPSGNPEPPNGIVSTIPSVHSNNKSKYKSSSTNVEAETSSAAQAKEPVWPGDGATTTKKQSYFTGYLHNRLKERDLLNEKPLTGPFRKQVAGEIATHLNKGIRRAAILMALDHMVFRWKENRISFTQAFDSSNAPERGNLRMLRGGQEEPKRRKKLVI